MGNTVKSIAIITASVCCASGTFVTFVFLKGMERLTGLLLLTLCAVGIAADPGDILRDLIWKHRVLLMFAPDSENDKYRRQNTILASATDGLLERDLIVIRAMADGNLSVDDVARSQSGNGFYPLFNIRRGEFRVVLIGKDGTIKMDRADPISSDVLFALIDAMPMRQNEMRQDGN